jgi:hypothetical protein
VRRRTVACAGLLAALALLAAPARAVHDGPLAGQWHLDAKASGGLGEETPDSSGHDGQHASAGTVTLSGGGRFDSHLSSSNGTVLFAGLSDELAPAHVTLVAWVRHSGAPPTLGYVAGRGGDGPGQGCTGSSYALYTGVTAPAAATFYIRPVSGGVVQSPAAPAGVWDGGWHLLAGVFDGSSVQLYVDGVAAGPATPAPGAAIDYELSSSSFTIDGYAEPTCGSGNFAGGIDEVRVYSRALSATEIGRLANPGATTPPVLVPDAPADLTAPDTTITAGPEQGEVVGDTPPSFTFASSEPGSTFECRVWDPDKQSAPAFTGCASPYQVPIPPSQISLEERTTFQVRAVDAAGNADPTPAGRTYEKRGKPVDGPQKVVCEEVDVVGGQGKLVRSGCRLAKVEKGKVRCVHLARLTVRSCRFGPRSGSFVKDRSGHRWAVVGQGITRKGKKNGPYVIAAPIEERKHVPCADVPQRVMRAIHGRDTAGSTTSSPMARGCTAEKLLFSTNSSGGPLVNVATREVCTSSSPHPDTTPQFTVREVLPQKAPGIHCYTGRGAGLNDPYGMERDANGVYLVQSNRCHFAMVTQTLSIIVGKRPASSGTVVTENSELLWRPVSPARIAN